MNEKRADALITQLEKTYDTIAEHFSNTRGYVWEELQVFEKQVSNGQHILDLGCGNGRLLELLKKYSVSYVGMDNSAKLLGKAQLKAGEYPAIDAHFKHGDMQQIPFLENSFDVVFCIATLHHMPSKERQLRVLKEIARVLKPGGTLCMTNWYLSAQPKYVLMQAKQRILNPKMYVGTTYRDFFIPWKDHNSTHFRYYYAFSKGELARLMRKAGLDIRESTTTYGAKDWSGRRTKRNIITVAGKPTQVAQKPAFC